MVRLLLGLAQPGRGQRVRSVFGRSPDEAVLAGKVGAMLQTGMRRSRSSAPRTRGQAIARAVEKGWL
jgi:hypothetical protein